ncbi:MAG: tetratricopeptide repeat protein [Oscillospiraceae bacterium]|nr:tetratricopeptide repeat protein [Oscillospiraceae bacterium]
MKKLLSLILVAMITMTILTSCGAADRAFVSSYLNLGEKYLTDLNYEQALVCFNKVIEVEPKNERAYLASAEAYVAMGDIDSAIEILEQGIETVDDPTKLQVMLMELLGEDEEEVVEQYNFDLVPDGAGEYDGHYYYVYDIESVTSWEDAKAYCESLNGYLATISSEEENEFLYNYIVSQGYSSAYIGLSDEDEEGTWVWTNGESIAYINWHKNEPNSESSNEDYAMFYYKYSDGTWNDGDFNGSTVNGGKVFICEWGDYLTDTLNDTIQ